MNRTIPAATSLSLSWGRAARVALMALLCLGAALQARAQGSAADADPPDRVARLSEANGQVWLFSPDANEWLAVNRNRPLTTGDRVATDNGAHAEITLGSTTLRLDSATELEIVLLDDNRYNVQLHSGSVAARLRNAQSVAEFALDTDEGRFRAQTVGRYRFDRFERASDLTVESGQAVFEGRNSALPLTTGQHAQFWVDAGGAAQYNMVEPARDSFAAWNAERDRAEVRPTAAVRYVSPEMTGAEDLDRYGQWEQTPEYGPIWTPRAVAVGWAPYNAGHWAYVRPWGWTWVDDAPWGFAPFHYGRWVYHRNAWCWAPGTYVARPVYAPALVAWIGGPSVSVSINIGGGPPVGWFPLAPREVYVPSYRYSQSYVRNINITHVTNVTQITTIVNNTNGAADRRDFANRKFPHAVTVVPASVLIGRQAVAPEAQRFRADPQVRALVADARPATMIVAPVATPPAAARPPSGRIEVRPPFEGRAPGVFNARPGQGPGQASPQGGAAPNMGRPAAPALAGRPVQAVPIQGDARPDGVPGRDADRDNRGRNRDPVRGEIQRPPRPNAAPAPNPAAAPNVAPVNPVSPGALPQVAPMPSADDRGRDRRRGGPDDSRPVGRPGAVPAPPINGASPAAPSPGRALEQRGGDSPRPGAPRAVEPREPRNAEAPRQQGVRPVEPRTVETLRPAPVRPAEAPRAQDSPRVVAPPVRPAESPRIVVTPVEAKPEPAKAERAAPEQRGGRPDNPRRDERRDRDDKPGEKQR